MQFGWLIIFAGDRHAEMHLLTEAKGGCHCLLDLREIHN